MDEAGCDTKEECCGGKNPHQNFISDAGRNFGKGGSDACLAPRIEALDKAAGKSVFVIESGTGIGLEVRFALASGFVKGLTNLLDGSLVGILVVGIVCVSFVCVVVLLLRSLLARDAFMRNQTRRRIG